MPSLRTWFPLQIKALSSDYAEYNNVLKFLIKQCDNPLHSNLNRIIEEEKKLSSKIIAQENILLRWFKDVPSFKEEFSEELVSLQDHRNVCFNLRHKGRSSLQTGLTLLNQEQRKIVTNLLPKSKKKETAPRLIDITL